MFCAGRVDLVIDCCIGIDTKSPPDGFALSTQYHPLTDTTP